MSKNSNQITLIWKDIEISSRRIVEGEPLVSSRLDIRTCQDALTLWFLLILDLLDQQSLQSRRVLSSLIITIEKLGLIRCVHSLKEFDGIFLEYIQEFSPQISYDDFKRHLRECDPDAGALIAPVKGFLCEIFTQQEFVGVQLVRTYFQFLSRLCLKDIDGLEEYALNDYLANEQRLGSLDLKDDLSEIMEEWFPPKSRYYIFDHFDPCHGPGSVAELKRKDGNALKFQNMFMDQKLKYFYNHISADHMDLPRNWIPCTESFRCSKVIFVAKSIDKRRTICSEPASLQWTQQGIFHSIQDYLADHPYLRRRVALQPTKRYPDPQEPNRELAFAGSFGGDFATIDLSAASDSVSWELIRRSFQHTGLREALWCSRSQFSELPTGEILRNKKFAPMGSALCFPIECLVFSGIIEKTLRNLGIDSNTSQYRVYGDDIVIESAYAGPVIDALQSYGFLVNETKSFFKTSSRYYFRESCGGDFFAGVNVTPARISRRFEGCIFNAHHPGRIEGVIELANQCRSFPSVRRYLIHQLNKLPAHLRVRFTSDGEGGVFSPQCTNHHLPRQWDDRYCAYVFSHGMSCVRYSRDDEDEDIRLFCYLHDAENRQSLTWPEDQVGVEVGSQISLKWTSTRSLLDESYAEKPTA